MNTIKGFILLLVLTGCFMSCEKKHESLPKGRFLKANLPGEPQTMDPRKGADLSSSAMHFLLYEGLTKVADDASIAYGVAKEIQISDDKLTYTFYLRDCSWSNGQPVTAHDFEYSWKTMLSPNFACPNAHLLYPIKNSENAKKGLIPPSEIAVKALSSKTLEVKLEKPTPYFLKLVSFCVFYPVNHKIVKNNPKWCEHLNEDFVSNGPFKLVKWRHENEIVFEKNEMYWNKDEVSLPGLQISLVKDENTALEMFMRKELDILGGQYTSISIDDPSSLIKSNHLNAYMSAKTQFCAFNVNKPPFNNIHIRHALSLSVDRESLVKTVGIMGEIPAVNFVPPALKEGKNKAFIKSFDPIKAKEELQTGMKELGMSEREFAQFTMIYPRNKLGSQIAQALQDQWRKNLGIQVQIESMDHNLYLSHLGSKNFDLCQSYWVAQYDDQMNILDRFKKRVSTKNYPGWENPKYIKLLDDSFLVTDDARNQILEEAEKIIMQDMPIAPLFHGCSYLAVQPEVKGIYTSPTGALYLEKIHFEEEPSNGNN